MAKAGQLAIQREEFGYVQRSAWRQADRLHEEVIDLDSPFSVSLAAGTHLYTFVLIGDQNAGKSTFLHSFACYQDENYLELSSLLPVLSSSFLNTRFLPEGDNRRAIDEPPFLDTDIARGTIAMVLDDFAFFVEEHNLDHSLVLDLPKGTRFVVVQFIEFGGDHLDQLMDASLIGSQRIADIVERSREMLRECRKIVYFVNGHTLFRDAAEQGCLHAASMATLERRLAFLNSSLLPADVGVMVHMTRPPAALSPETAAHILASTRAALHISGEDDASSAASTTAAAAVDAGDDGAMLVTGPAAGRRRHRQTRCCRAVFCRNRCCRRCARTARCPHRAAASRPGSTARCRQCPLRRGPPGGRPPTCGLQSHRGRCGGHSRWSLRGRSRR
eukprot:m.159968 g.159968  ORF g.159968 m.159968 type:complete len:388 (+) comp17048_c2_seq2:188-1351(+)